MRPKMQQDTLPTIDFFSVDTTDESLMMSLVAKVKIFQFLSNFSLLEDFWMYKVCTCGSERNFLMHS